MNLVLTIFYLCSYKFALLVTSLITYLLTINEILKHSELPLSRMLIHLKTWRLRSESKEPL